MRGPGESTNRDGVKSKRRKRCEWRREERRGLIDDDVSACDYWLLLQLLPVSWLELSREQRLSHLVALEAPNRRHRLPEVVRIVLNGDGNLFQEVLVS